MAVESGWPSEYDLGIKDYLIGGGLWAVHLLTRQMNHPPVETAPTAPTLPTERMATIPGNYDSEGTAVLEQMLASHEIES